MRPAFLSFSCALSLVLLLIPSTTSFLPQSAGNWQLQRSRSLESTSAGSKTFVQSGQTSRVLRHEDRQSCYQTVGRNIAMAAGEGQLSLAKGPDVPIVLVGGGAERSKVAQALSSLTSRPIKVVQGNVQEAVAADGAAILECADASGLGGLRGGEAVVLNLVTYDGQGSCATREGAFDVAVGQGPSVDGVVVTVTPEQAAKEVLRLYRFCLAPPASKHQVDLMMGANTFFLSLTYPEVSSLLPILAGLEEGVDALELRVDLLKRQDEWSVLQQMGLLKRHSGLPVIFTVRSKGQVGAFPDDPDALFALLHLGLRAGVEVLDVEANWERHYRDDLIKTAGPYRGRTLLLGSYHVVGRPTTDDQARALFRECYHDGDVDGVKVVLTAMDVRDSYRVHEVASSLQLPVPIIALCLGEKGKLSRVLNSRYTPVTSDMLPTPAAPGQLTSSTIMRLRQEVGMLPKRRFFLLGHPISQSPSPAMHNAGFAKCQMPHEYGLFETEDVATFESTLRAADFGGASVTIPHKETIGQFIDRVDPAAQAIGAINTVIPEVDPVSGKVTLVGDNTDWKGILAPVKDRLLRCKGGDVLSKGAALVVGGGGTSLAAAYAMTQLGLKVVVYNRTPAKARAVADRFQGVAIEALTPQALKDATGGRELVAIVSTIPAAAGFTVPAELLSNRPVVMDAAYKPAETALLAQARDAGCPFVQGAEMLIGQGIEQFERWTKRQAPADVMRAAVYSKVEELK